MKTPDPELLDDDLPELDEAFFTRARPAAEVLGEAFMATAARAKPKSANPKASRP